MNLINTFICFVISLFTFVIAEETTTNTTTLAAEFGAKQTLAKPQYSILSYLAGLIVMMVFVMVPVGLMAYRNRNSIVEFIKNR